MDFKGKFEIKMRKFKIYTKKKGLGFKRHTKGLESLKDIVQTRSN